MSALAGLACSECGSVFDADRVQTVCQACDSPLLARYDLERVGDTLDRDELSRRLSGLWRWAELLPVRDPAWRLTLGEGDTPLHHVRRLGDRLGLRRLFVKDEGLNPTGTFKARGLAVAVGRASELGVREFVIPTAGNAGGALAAYAARAGLKAHVFMPGDAPRSSRVEVAAAGADLVLVDGLIDLAGRQAAATARSEGWFDISTFREPYRVEGKKTMGLEMAEAFGWELPEVVVYPTGGGAGLVGIWKAFEELQALGWVGARRPRLVCVQSAGCAPVARALERNADRVEPWPDARTAAQGLRVPRPYADRLILRAVRESGGTGLVVTDDEMRRAQVELAQAEGILACLEGAATLAGLHKLLETGWIDVDERVVLLNTGSGLKHLQ
ncbi:MAG: threonine synthase [Anaerolineales bacterium]|nr:threonine synthase [Anaerolineales bacterium]